MRRSDPAERVAIGIVFHYLSHYGRPEELRRDTRTADRTARETIKKLHEAFAGLANGVLQYVLLDLQHHR